MASEALMELDVAVILSAFVVAVMDLLSFSLALAKISHDCTLVTDQKTIFCMLVRLNQRILLPKFLCSSNVPVIKGYYPCGIS